MVTYNHERYVAEAIRSVLGQTFSDWELIIVNDGSSDTTLEIINSFVDPRIRCITQNNQGPSVAINTAIEACRGKYTALFSGDDVCMPDRLSTQLDEYTKDNTQKILFSGCKFIDDQSCKIDRNHFAKDTFSTVPRSRAEILHHFFFKGNFINAATAFAEREVFRLAGPFDNSLYQLQDFDMWIRMAKRHEIRFSPQSLLKYRIRSNNENLSAPDPRHVTRSTHEAYLVMRRFFDELSDELFMEAFHDSVRKKEERLNQTETSFEQAMLYFDSEFSPNYLLAIELLQSLLNNPVARECLGDTYSFTTKSFANLLKDLHVSSKNNRIQSSLYVDIGDGFTENSIFRSLVDPNMNRFSISFQLTGGLKVQGVRWDPVEGRLCRIRVNQISYRNIGGGVHQLDLSKLAHNGFQSEDGFVLFTNGDPRFLLDTAGEIVEVMIVGEWEIEENFASILREQSADSLYKETECLRQRKISLEQKIADLERQRTDLESLLREVEGSISWKINNFVGKPIRLLRDFTLKFL